MARSRIYEYPRVAVRDRAAWRKWLQANHGKSEGIWLALEKKGGPDHRLKLDEAVEEALCFGWIDSLPNKLDATRYLLLLTPRKPGSVWSKINKVRAERMIASGLMTAPGLAKIEAARNDGSWNSLDRVEAMHMPDDLAAALAANREAKTNFEGFSASARKGLLYWIDSAKRAETRKERIARAVVSAAQGQIANQYWPKGKKAKVATKKAPRKKTASKKKTSVRRKSQKR